MTDIHLLHERADVWLFNEGSIDAAAARVRAMQVLSADERARYQRLMGPRARRLYLGGRMVMRYALAAYTNTSPGEIRFAAGQFGRPEIEYPQTSLRFNMSHTTGLVGCVVAQDRLCGIDIERIPAPTDIVTAVAEFLSQEERAHISASEDPARTTLEYWVIKEAYLKAMGVGLQRPLDSFVMTGLGDTLRVHDPDTYGLQWQLEIEQLTCEHVVGLALARSRTEPDRIPVRLLDFEAFLCTAFPGPGSPRQAPGMPLCTGSHPDPSTPSDDGS